jgi:hypothetical protein
MSQPNGHKKQSVQTNGDHLSEDTIKKFLENQQKQISLEAEAQKFKFEELKANARLAEKAMELQAAHLSRQPLEGRKNITRMGYIVGGLLMVFFLFIGFCLYLGKDEFIMVFLKGCSYLATTGMGYWFGRRVGKEGEKSKEQDAFEEVEVINTGN